MDTIDGRRCLVIESRGPEFEGSAWRCGSRLDVIDEWSGLVFMINCIGNGNVLELNV